MIPMQGTAEVRHCNHRGEKRHTTCTVIAANEEGDLLVIPLWLGRLAPRWASEIGTITNFIPAPAYVPAAPGWWARFASHEEETDTVGTYLLPVVSFRVGDDETGVVVVFDDGEVIVDPGQRIGDALDAVFFDPDHRADPPPVSEDEARVHAANRRELAKLYAADLEAPGGAAE